MIYQKQRDPVAYREISLLVKDVAPGRDVLILEMYFTFHSRYMERAAKVNCRLIQSGQADI